MQMIVPGTVRNGVCNAAMSTASSPLPVRQFTLTLQPSYQLPSTDSSVLLVFRSTEGLFS